jgi:hypothetical protein
MSVLVNVIKFYVITQPRAVRRQLKAAAKSGKFCRLEFILSDQVPVRARVVQADLLGLKWNVFGPDEALVGCFYLHQISEVKPSR